MAVVALLGDINIDLTLSIPAYPAEGGEAIATSQRHGLGGSATNTAVALARLGQPARLLARVGSDSWGASAVSDIAASGVDTSAIARDSLEPTQINVVTVSPGGERTMFAYRGANARLSPEDISEVSFADVGLLHLSGYALLAQPQRRAALKSLCLAENLGIPATFDLPSGIVPTIREDVIELLPRLEMLMLGAGDALVLTGKPDLDSAIEMLTGAGLKQVAVKLGGSGSRLVRRDGSYEAPGFSVNVVDTTGAGDAFAAGQIIGHLAGIPADQCCALANALGAVAVTRQGGALTDLNRKTVEAVLGRPLP